MPGDNVQLVREIHAAFSRGDFDAFFAACTPTVEWVAAREDPDAATHRGRAEVERYFAQWGETIAGLSVEPQEYIDAGDRVFVWIRVTGRSGCSRRAACASSAPSSARWSAPACGKTCSS